MVRNPSHQTLVSRRANDLDTGCLLCGHHHRLIHHGDWQITIRTDRHPSVIPPAWIDPDQKPLRNTYFKPKPQP